MENYNFFEKLNQFDSLLPQVKLVIIMTLSFFILLSIISYIVLRFQFPNVKKLFGTLSLILLVMGLIISFKQFPNNENEKYYPNITQKQTLTIINKDNAILTGETGNKYLVTEGRLSPIKDD